MDNNFPNILITGTPGVGKTCLGKLLEDKVKEEGNLGSYEYISVSELIKEKQLYTSWNEEFDVPEVDEDLICDELEGKMQRGGVILEFHSSDLFPKRWFDLVVLLRTNNTLLYDRLIERGYNQTKINENIQCEIMEITSEEVYAAYDKERIIELVSDIPLHMQTNLDLVYNRIIHIIHNSLTIDKLLPI